MNSIEEYQNVVELLKKALEFYANKNNYIDCQHIHYELFSLIEMDAGNQARFALDKIQELENLNKVMEENFMKEITDKVNNVIDDEDNAVIKSIKEIKDINNEILNHKYNSNNDENNNVQ